MKRILASLALASVFVLGGCGGDDPAPAPPTPDEPTGGNPPADPDATPTDPTATPPPTATPNPPPDDPDDDPDGADAADDDPDHRRDVAGDLGRVRRARAGGSRARRRVRPRAHRRPGHLRRAHHRRPRRALAGASWFGRDGAPLTEWFAYDASAGWFPDLVARAATLADGSVVVGLGRAGALRFESGVAGAAPPPAWVTSRAGATIATVRGGRANAFAFVGSRSPCEARVEILTPVGERCGTIRLDATLCDSATFGADRTVFTTHTAQDGTCTWRWWTGLLR